ncbi:MAG: polysaccharide deacetylase family protein [Clostridia bacterium]|nr:polysaccharide deacetylase family protein [Clostridia bacterium]
MKKRMTALLLLLALCLALPALGEEAAKGNADAMQETPKKYVYLTFDDGPKADTPELLALLEELDVPATFFFVGAKVHHFPEMARLVYEKGYTIGCHSYYHAYNRLRDREYLQKDYDKFIGIMREIVDPAFDTKLYRFPGGSTSYPAKTRRFVADELGLAWFDWNAMTNDTAANKTSEDLYRYAVRGAADEEVVILLAHEGIYRTREMLPDLVQYFRDRGFEFRSLSLEQEDRDILARSTAKMMLPGEGDAAEEQ